MATMGQSYELNLGPAPSLFPPHSPCTTHQPLPVIPLLFPYLHHHPLHLLLSTSTPACPLPLQLLLCPFLLLITAVCVDI